MPGQSRSFFRQEMTTMSSLASASATGGGGGRERSENSLDACSLNSKYWRRPGSRRKNSLMSFASGSVMVMSSPPSMKQSSSALPRPAARRPR
jgi:hypothetical protein